MLVAGGIVPAGDERAFRDFCRMLSAVFHFEVHDLVERLKDLYRPHSPDSDPVRPPSDGAPLDSADAFIESFEELLNKANYERLSRVEIEEAFRAAAIVDVAVKVRHEDFAVERFHVRGPVIHSRVARSWYGLRRRRIDYEVYDRVALLIRFKGADHFAATARKPPPFAPGTIAIKLFKAVPKADLEVLYPGSDVTMRLMDRLVLGIPTVVGGVPLLGKMGAALTVLFGVIAGVLGYEGITDEDRLKQALASLTAAAALGSFAFQRWTYYQSRRNEFHRDLAHNLYFRNLANNGGALFQLADSAEEEEVKEMLLAYCFLLATPDGLAPNALNRRIESWFLATHGRDLVFECPDALDKLMRFGLVRTLPDGRVAPLGLAASLVRLDAVWDGYFRFPQPALAADRGPA
jgi:hypothetical protein